MKTKTNQTRVATKQQFITTTLITGLLILVAALFIAVGVTWASTRHYEPAIHYQALKTATILPMLIVPACVAIIGFQGFRNHRDMMEVTRLAHTDEMTGLANRRAFMREAVELLEATDIEYEGLCLFIVDLDHFKRVNDRHGHDAGDKVLIHAAQKILKAVPHGSLVARLGGEEFAVMMSYRSIMDIHDRAEAIRVRIADHTCCVGGLNIKITASVGAGIAHPRDTVSSIMCRADNALYEAKHEGRNRFTIAA